MPVDALDTHLYCVGMTGKGKSSYLLSLLELLQLLTNKPYRERLLDKVDDGQVRHFFHDRFDRWGRETPLMIESLLNKSTALTLNPYLAPMLGASECLDLRGIMDRGQVLLVNLRTPDEETRNLLGSLLMTSFEQAALSREALPRHQRRRFFLFVDEFQKFTANEGSVTTLAEILSECRKYALHLVFAHQSWGQLSGHQRLSGALEQAQVKAIFGSGRQTAQNLAASLYSPDTEEIKHEVEDPDQQARTHPLFESVANQLETAVQEIMRLRRRHILVKLPESDTLLRLRTPALPSPRISQAELQRLQHTLAGIAGGQSHASSSPDSQRMAPAQSRVDTTALRAPHSAPWIDDLWHLTAKSSTTEQVVFQA